MYSGEKNWNLSDISRPLTNRRAIPLFSPVHGENKWNTALIGQSGAHELLPLNHVNDKNWIFETFIFCPIFYNVPHMTSRTTERRCSWKGISHYSAGKWVGLLLFSTLQRVSPELEEQRSHYSSWSEFENQIFSLTKEAIVLTCDSTSGSEISTRCSDNDKIAALATMKFIPNFTPARAITYTNRIIRMWGTPPKAPLACGVMCFAALVTLNKMDY